MKILNEVAMNETENEPINSFKEELIELVNNQNKKRFNNYNDWYRFVHSFLKRIGLDGFVILKIFRFGV